MVDAVRFLHMNKIIHCDLKLENVMISPDNTVKIVDFDLSKLCDDSLEYMSDAMIGTEKYLAPESYDLHIYSSKSDVWALGVILYVLITKRFPVNSLCFNDACSNMYRMNKFKLIDYDILKKEIRKKKYDTSLYPLVKKMLKFNERDRIDISDILKKV